MSSTIFKTIEIWITEDLHVFEKDEGANARDFINARF